jgi:hypothetical protein
MTMQLELASPEFFSTPPTKLVVDDHLPNTGRTYILKADKIVAVIKDYAEIPEAQTGAGERADRGRSPVASK